MGTSARTSMVSVPAGRVTLSDRRLQQSWPVEVAAYELSAFPVTQELYAEVTGWWPGTARGDRLPVEGVTWWDAVRFCNLLSGLERLTPTYHSLVEGEDIEWDASADGYRLPTEAEWEHACRAETAGARYGPLDDVAWYRGNSGEQLHPVGGKQPNTWGLHDMLGDVWEWCWDLYDADVYGPYRVLRGGGWFDEHWSCRASVRRRSHPALRIDDVGFRGRAVGPALSRVLERRRDAVPLPADVAHPALDRDAGHRLGWGRPDVPATDGAAPDPVDPPYEGATDGPPRPRPTLAVLQASADVPTSETGEPRA